MKFNKKNLLSLLAIVLCAFIIIPLILILFNINPYTISEGMAGYDTTYRNTNIDRIDMSGVTYKDSDGNDVSGGSDDYIYCLGGKIECNDHGDVSFQGTYTNSNGDVIGDTYRYECVRKDNPHLIKDGYYATCSSILGSKGNIKFYNENMDVSYNISNNVDASFNGFTDVFKEIPMQFDASHTYLIIYNGDVSFESSPCFLYDSSSHCIDDYYNIETTTKSSDTDSNCEVSDSTKCLANNGSNVGDPLCCGQSGVVQDTKYNCPSETPICVGYKCGSTWGKCVKNE